MKRDYSKVPNELRDAIFDHLIDQGYCVNGKVEELEALVVTIPDTAEEKLAKVKESFPDSRQLYVGVASMADARRLAVLLGLPDTLVSDE
jgi:hypothetical protein